MKTVWNLARSWFIRLQNWLVALLLIGSVLIGFRLMPHPPLSEGLPQSIAVYDAKGTLLRLTLAKDERYRIWMPLGEISPELINGVLLHEDQWFYYHVGFNPVSLIRGGWETYAKGAQRQGGSTVTMQLARLRWKLNTRTLTGKLIQIVRALQLELSYSKHDILEAYLNYAPFGGNIEGAQSASLIYFNKSASKLNLPEALTLAVLPQSPSKRISKVSHNNERIAGELLIKARQRLLSRWLGKYPEDEIYRPLFDLPLLMRPISKVPFYAPHFVNQALDQSKYKPRSRLDTTLDLSMQQALEYQIKAFIDRNKVRGITNATALLVDTRDMGIKALVGSADFFNKDIHGQVNGTLAKRSPGSTLKPFIYGLGIDQGILHPLTILWDIPKQFGGYTPENFDYQFLGPITATDALIKSRNIPAVTVTSQLKEPSFYQFLRQARINKLISERHYGLSLALGGGEVSMQELAKLYAMLANEGEMRELVMTPSVTPEKGARLLSQEAIFITLQMLKQNPPPNELQRGQPSRLPIYWKTGTSWGFRDAWTVGLFGSYVLVVWTGNFNGSGNQAFVGVDAAAPLFFSMIEHLQSEYPDIREPARKIPESVTQVDVCLASGDLPTHYCERTGKTWFIPGKSPIKVDQVYRPVMIDNETGLVACPPYNPHTTHMKVFEFWPSELERVFARMGITKRKPPLNSECRQTANDQGQPPKITSPIRSMTYTLRRSKLKENRIALTANIDGSSRKMYWFANSAYLAHVQAGQIYYWNPNQAGSFIIQVVDDYGRTDSMRINVNVVE